MLSIFTPWSVVIGLVLASPALLAAFTDPQTPVEPAVVRFLIATVLAGIGLRLLRSLMSAYAEGQGRPQRRAGDVEADAVPTEPAV